MRTTKLVTIVFKFAFEICFADQMSGLEMPVDTSWNFQDWCDNYGYQQIRNRIEEWRMLRSLGCSSSEGQVLKILTNASFVHGWSHSFELPYTERKDISSLDRRHRVITRHNFRFVRSLSNLTESKFAGRCDNFSSIFTQFDFVQELAIRLRAA